MNPLGLYSIHYRKFQPVRSIMTNRSVRLRSTVGDYGGTQTLVNRVGLESGKWYKANTIRRLCGTLWIQ